MVTMRVLMCILSVVRRLSAQIDPAGIHEFAGITLKLLASSERQEAAFLLTSQLAGLLGSYRETF